jgi:hypothetical protein
MFETLTSPEKAFNFKLGAALKMEQTVLEMLEENIENSQAENVKKSDDSLVDVAILQGAWKPSTTRSASTRT